MSYRSSEQLLDVKTFGAKGDGAHDDTAAIQAAITAAPSGHAIFFPDGNYKITAQLTWTGKKLSLVGTGKSSIVEGTAITATGTGGALVYASGSGVSDSSVEFLNCTGIETYGAYNGSSTKEFCFLRFSGADGIVVEGVKVSGKSTGMVLDTCTNVRVDRFNFAGLLTSAATGGGTGTDAFNIGIKIKAGSRNSIRDMVATNCGCAISSAFATNKSDRMLVSGLSVDNAWSQGVVLNGADSSTVTNCTVQGITGTGIEVRGNRNVVSSNHVYNCTKGVVVSGYSGDSADSYGAIGRGTIVLANRVENTTQDGIVVDVVSSHDARNFRVESNYTKTTGTATGSYGAIKASGYFHQIVGNTSEDHQASYGIWLLGFSGDNVEGVDLSGNFVVGASAAGIRLDYTKLTKVGNNFLRNIAGAGIDIHNSQNLEVFANKKEASVTGTFISATAGNGNSTNLFYNNDATVDAPEGNIPPGGTGGGSDATTLQGSSPSVSTANNTIALRGSTGTLQAANSASIGSAGASGFVVSLDGSGLVPVAGVPYAVTVQTADQLGGVVAASYRLKVQAPFAQLFGIGNLASATTLPLADYTIVRGAKTLNRAVISCPSTGASGSVTVDIVLLTTAGTGSPSSILTSTVSLSGNSGANWSTITSGGFSTTAIPDNSLLGFKITAAGSGYTDIRVDFYE